MPALDPEDFATRQAGTKTPPGLSIWSDRWPAVQHQMPSRRARAGTLPSRMPAINTQTPTNPPDQLGSLALLSPDGNDVLWDNHSPPRRPFLPGRGTVDNLMRPNSARVRSGSLNSLAAGPFMPSNSIWSSSSAGASSLSPASSVGPETIDDQDPMRFYNIELQKSSEPSRLRSYTLTSPAAYDKPVMPVGSAAPGAPPASSAAAGVPPVASKLSVNHLGHMAAPSPLNWARPRAQTLSNVPTATNNLPLGVLGKQRQPMHELPNGPPVVTEDPSALRTNTIWISNVPHNITEYTLQAVFGVFGRIEASRVYALKHCGVVTFQEPSSAAAAQAARNGTELFAGLGPSVVKLVKPNEGSLTPPLKTTSPGSPPSSGIAYILQSLEVSPVEVASSMAALKRGEDFIVTEEIIGPQEPTQERVYGSGILRETRKRIDMGAIGPKELEELALDAMSELPQLASDYIGNTVVQQLFERCSEDIKDMMTRALMPVLAYTGTHKNGTWATQKVIGVANTKRQFSMITKALQPYTVGLLLDQFGNYVIQGCLRFGAPWNDWVFEACATHLPEIAAGRFGARAVRTCLESPHTTKQHQRLVAAAIIHHTPQLAVNPNGVLLVTWLLDTYPLAGPQRWGLVAAQLVPHLSQMCISKLAGLTVLKVITNKVDPAAGRLLLNTLLEPTSDAVPPALEQVLQDPAHGPMFLYRLLTVGLPDTSLERHVAINKIRMVLLQPGAVVPNHKRLLEEVGLLHVLMPEDAGLASQ